MAEERYPAGEQCNVCHFPTGPDSICGAPVYVVEGNGKLPKYCGAPGQEQYNNGTGDTHHVAELAGNARRSKGLTPARCDELAGQMFKRRPRTKKAVTVSSGHLSGSATVESSTPASAPPAVVAPPEDRSVTADVADSPVAAVSAVERPVQPHVDTVAANAVVSELARVGELLLAAGQAVTEVGDRFAVWQREQDARLQAAEAERDKALLEVADAREEAEKARAQAQEARKAQERAEWVVDALKNGKTAEMPSAPGEEGARQRRVRDVDGSGEARQHRLTGPQAMMLRAVAAGVVVVGTDAGKVVWFVQSIRAYNGPETTLNTLANKHRYLEWTESDGGSRVRLTAAGRQALQGAPAAGESRPSPLSLSDMRTKVEGGGVSRRVVEEFASWFYRNVMVSWADAETLEWMSRKGEILVGAGSPAEVSLAEGVAAG